MLENKRISEVKEILTRHYWSHNNIELIIPIVAALIDHCRIDRLVPIITELLSDDPLVERITEIYGQGGTLWFALQKTIAEHPKRRGLCMKKIAVIEGTYVRDLHYAMKNKTQTLHSKRQKI